MNKKNSIAALFSFAALTLLFFKLPGVRDFLGFKRCTQCGPEAPFITMLAVAYFGFFTAILLSFNDFAGKTGAKFGLLWAIGLCVVLTLLRSELCTICLTAHGLHIAAWCALLTKKSPAAFDKTLIGLKISCACTTSISVVALYSSLNFTFALYGLGAPKNQSSLIAIGEKAPMLERITNNTNLHEETLHTGIVLDFVSSQCPYCKEQLVRIKDIAEKFKETGIRFVAITEDNPETLQALAPNVEWIKDIDGSLHNRYGVSGYPTMVVLDKNARVIQATSGMPSDYEKTLETELHALQ